MPTFESKPQGNNGRRVLTIEDSTSGHKKQIYPPGQDMAKEMQQDHRAEVAAQEASIAPARISEPRCNVCQHAYRDWVEMMLIKGQSYKSIATRVPGTERRSIANHYKNHMDLQDAALRKIIEDEARLQGINHEEGVNDAITKRAVLEVALRKGYEDILNGVTTVEPRDLVQIAKVLADMDTHQYATGLDEVRTQMNLYTQAIKNVCQRMDKGEEFQTMIVKEIKTLRTREGVAQPVENAMMDKPAEIEEEYIEAEVVEESEV